MQNHANCVVSIELINEKMTSLTLTYTHVKGNALSNVAAGTSGSGSEFDNDARAQWASTDTHRYARRPRSQSVDLTSFGLASTSMRNTRRSLLVDLCSRGWLELFRFVLC